MHFDISHYIYSLSYLGVYLWFAIFEQLTIIPEEVSLMSLGYMTVHGNLNPLLSGIVALIGLLSTDGFLFLISVKGGKISDNILKKINASMLQRVKKNLQANSVKTLFIMALLPKLRFISPIVAGAGGINWKVFFSVNSIATAIYVVIYMLAGIFFHDRLYNMLSKMQYMQHIIFITSMIAIGIFLIVKIRKAILNHAG